MNIVFRTGRQDLAEVYIARTGDGKLIEFVHSLQPPMPREKKWVLTISTLYGCPVGCAFCDAGTYYDGKLSLDDLLWQTDFLVRSFYPDMKVPVDKFKVQFARTGEPALNQAVLDALSELPRRYDAPGLMPSLSTIAPRGTDAFFERLLDVREIFGPRFQLQFSIHSTDEDQRERLLPVKKWDFSEIANYGGNFHRGGHRKVTLNFALAQDSIVSPEVIHAHFDPSIFLIKMTPVNPTGRAMKDGIISSWDRAEELTDRFMSLGYDVAPSAGEYEENRIGSNCGQYINSFIRERPDDAYSYELEECTR